MWVPYVYFYTHGLSVCPHDLSALRSVCPSELRLCAWVRLLVPPSVVFPRPSHLPPPSPLPLLSLRPRIFPTSSPPLPRPSSPLLTSPRTPRPPPRPLPCLLPHPLPALSFPFPASFPASSSAPPRTCEDGANLDPRQCCKKPIIIYIYIYTYVCTHARKWSRMYAYMSA